MQRLRIGVISFIAIALGPAVWTAGICRAGDSVGVWRTDFAAAEAEAEREQKPLLIHFSASWCLPCAKMDREVLKSKEVRHLLVTRLIGVKVDGDDRPDLIRRFNVLMYPSDVIIDPSNGRVLKESQGVSDRKQYLSMANQAEVTFQRLFAQNQERNRQQNIVKNSVPPAVIPEPFGPVTIELGESRPLVGIDGFSPVALIKHRRWVRGSAELTWDHQGVTYQFSSLEERAEFREDPQRFAPRLLGCDPVILLETDRAVAGRTQYGAFFDDALYFFISAENRRRFKANPERFIKTQHVFKVDQIDRTALQDDTAIK